MTERLSQLYADKPEKTIRRIPLLFLITVAIISLHDSFSMSGTFQQITWKRKLQSAEEEEELPTTDTTVIIISSLIPTYPSIWMVDGTVDSIRQMIGGLDQTTPILISVDGRKEYSNDDIERLQKYVENLRARFRQDAYVTIVNNYQFGHISNSIRVVLQLVETEFIYVVQHDFKFIKPINHTALVGVMRQNPDQIRIVRFNKQQRPGAILDVCAEYNKFESEKYGIYLTLAHWSDNNHFTTKKYYEEVLGDIGHVPRPVEAPMMNKPILNASSDCTYSRQYIYNWKHGPFIEHLDGRLTLE